MAEDCEEAALNNNSKDVFVWVKFAKHVKSLYLSLIPGKTRKAHRIEVARATNPEERSTVARRLKSLTFKLGDYRL